MNHVMILLAAQISLKDEIKFGNKEMSEAKAKHLLYHTILYYTIIYYTILYYTIL